MLSCWRAVPAAVLVFALLASLPPARGQGSWRVPRAWLPDRVRPIDTVMVRFRPEVRAQGPRQMARAASALSLPGMRIARVIDRLGIAMVRVEDPAQLQQAAAALRRVPGTLYAEPAQRVRLLSVPNDPYFLRIDTENALFPGNEWPYQWPLQFVQASSAWGIWPNKFYTAASKPITAPTVAVIDTGTDITHPDFANAGGTSPDSRYGGQLDLLNSANLIDAGENPDPLDPSDEHGHGTHVAGIIAAATNNGVGIAALGYPAQVMTLKVVDASGYGSDSDIVAALVWAADHGAVVVNVSLGTEGGYSQALQDAVDYCWSKNTLVVAAAGNDGVDYVRRYPAACNRVLAVAATTFASPNTVPPDETTASYSNSGTYVGISAPGGDASYFNGGDFGFTPEVNTLVWSTTPQYPVTMTSLGYTTATYGYLNGTSMASPHAAALAILYAGYKGYTQATPNAPRLIVRAIQRGADNIAGRANGAWTPSFGHGRINALATMQDALGDGRTVATPGSITGQVTYGGPAVFGASVTATNSATLRKYGASTKDDGTYRIAAAPAGTYSVSAVYNGIKRTIPPVTVEAACDTMAADFDFGAAGVAVSVTPPEGQVPLGGQMQLSAAVTGTVETSVQWSVVSGPGSVDASGVYYAPAAAVTPAIATVRAISTASPSSYGAAQITVQTALSALAVTDPVVKGGYPTRGTVTLTGLAPAGGAVVALASSNAVVAVPTSVTVPSGARSASFNVTTSVVTEPVAATITASYAGVVREAVVSARVGTAISIYAATAMSGRSTTVRAILYTGGKPLGSKVLQFAVNGVPVGSAATDVVGTAGVPYTVPLGTAAGAYSITATFEAVDDPVYFTSTRTSQVLTVTRGSTGISIYAASATLGKSAALKCVLVSGSAVLEGKTIAFAVDGAPAGAGVTDAAGIASAGYVLPLALGAGLHNVTATFDGAADPAFLGTARTSAVLTATKVPTSFSLYAASGSPGQTVQLRCIMAAASSPLPGKTVAFLLEGVAVGSGVTDASGVASVMAAIPSGMTLGLHNLTVAFDGSADPVYASGSRTTAVVTVR